MLGAVGLGLLALVAAFISIALRRVTGMDGDTAFAAALWLALVLAVILVSRWRALWRQ